MQDCTVDNRRVFHSHPITVKRDFFRPKTHRGAQWALRRDKISLCVSRPVPCPPHTKGGKKSDPLYMTPVRAISRSRLNKDSSHWGADRDGKHLVFELGPLLALRIPPLISGPRKPPSYKSSDETASLTHEHFTRPRSSASNQGWICIIMSWMNECIL